MRKRKDMPDKVLVQIKIFYIENGYPPSIRELCRQFGYKSTSSVAHYMDILKDRGEITLVGKTYKVRGIKVSFDDIYTL